jgi:hypothetical protein
MPRPTSLARSESTAMVSDCLGVLCSEPTKVGCIVHAYCLPRMCAMATMTTWNFAQSAARSKLSASRVVDAFCSQPGHREAYCGCQATLHPDIHSPHRILGRDATCHCMIKPCHTSQHATSLALPRLNRAALCIILSMRALLLNESGACWLWPCPGQKLSTAAPSGCIGAADASLCHAGYS